jgi:phosphohistidine phosphatase
MMELLVVRHGIAQPREAGLADADRALTDKGRRRTAQAAEGLRRLGCRPDRIGTSPLKRARQTANILAEVLNQSAVVEACDFLVPGGGHEELLTWLRELEQDSVMIVGHQPDLADTVVKLLCASGTFDLSFRKAAACCVSFCESRRAGAGCLEWLMQPRQLRALSEA